MITLSKDNSRHSFYNFCSKFPDAKLSWLPTNWTLQFPRTCSTPTTDIVVYSKAWLLSEEKSFPGQKHQFLYIVNWRIFSMIQEKETLGSSLGLIFTIILAWRQKNYLQLTFCPNRKSHVKRIYANKPTTQDFPIFSPYNQSIGPSDTIWTMTKTIASFPLEWLRTHSQGKGPQ